jgi:hypothetical protein
MRLKRIIRGMLGQLSEDGRALEAEPGGFEDPVGAALIDARKMVLNVGGGSKEIPIPDHYSGWNHLLLDVAPGLGVDLVKDARELSDLPSGLFDAVYCSHNLEHYFRHEARKVLAGFFYVLKDEGFVELRVPDMRAVLKHYVTQEMDIDDVLYTAAGGPITVHDVIYGWGRQIEQSGQPWYAHKCGFTSKSLNKALSDAGFTSIYMAEVALEIRVLAFKQEPSREVQALLGLNGGE